MSIEKKEIEYAKETNDVMELVIEIIKTVKNKGSYTGLMDELITAIDGASDIAVEAKNLKVMINTVGGRAGDIVDALLNSAK